MSKKTKTIAIIGHRGIPSRYGGFETFAEKITPILIKNGYRVINYCRSYDRKRKIKTYLGSELRYLPTVKIKSLETIIHTFLSVVDVLFRPVDSIILVNVGNSPLAWIPRLRKIRVILNVDGLEWNRKKWGGFAKLYFKLCAWIATFTANEIVTDGKAIQDYYYQKFGKSSTMIPYGAEIIRQKNPMVLKKYGLVPGKYFLFVSRFEPENNPLLVRKAYEMVKTRLPLVMVGDAPYAKKYIKQVKQTTDQRIKFLGCIYGEDYKVLQQNAYAYIRASEVNGSSPALIEAMGYGNCVIYNYITENNDVVGEAGFGYKLNLSQLKKAITYIADHPELARNLGYQAQSRVKEKYSWVNIANNYLQLLFPPEKSKILITGSAGMLGNDVYQHFKNNYEVLATALNLTEPWLTRLDVTNQTEFEKTVKKFKPDYIFHLAAETDLEKCQQNKERTYLINTNSVADACLLARKYHAQLVYISTANVFNGKKDGYSITDRPQPINHYGKSKYCGELLVKKYLDNYYIIRAGWMIGGGMKKDKKFVGNIIRQIVGGYTELKVIAGKRSSLTYSKNFAENIERIIKGKFFGVHHLVCSGYFNRYELAKEIIKLLGYKKIIKLSIVPNNYFKHKYFCQRPATEKMFNDLSNKQIKIISWQEALKDYLEKEYKQFAYQSTIFEKIKDVLANTVLSRFL